MSTAPRKPDDAPSAPDKSRFMFDTCTVVVATSYTSIVFTLTPFWICLVFTFGLCSNMYFNENGPFQSDPEPD